MPTSDFAEGDISVELSGYKKYRLEAYISKTSTKIISVETSVNATLIIDRNVRFTHKENNGLHLFTRTFTPSDNKKSGTFSDCYKYQWLPAEASVTMVNNQLIPYRIYGIKGVS